VDHSQAVSPLTPWSKLFITGECVIFRCIDGSTADWIVEYDGKIPCKCHLRNSTINTDLFVSANTPYQCTYDQSDIDIGDIGDLTAEDITIRRAGSYTCATGFASADTATDGEIITAFVRKNNGATTLISSLTTASGTKAFQGASCFGTFDLSVDDTVEGWGRFEQSTNMDLAAATAVFLEVVEVF
jgi:hypothetical protein